MSLPALVPSPIEWELDPVTMKRTGRWRRRQFYAAPGMRLDKRPLSQRKACEWREGTPR